VNHLVPLYSRAPVPALVAAPDERASMRFLEFFAANIRNPHTRRAYARAAEEFPAWCAAAGVSSAASAHDATPGAGSTTSSQPSPMMGEGSKEIRCARLGEQPFTIHNQAQPKISPSRLHRVTTLAAC
jgi:hypothetical protein